MQGAIAAGHPQTAEAGAAMLRAGGNAVDAAVAAAFASFVAEACIVNIGGGGVALISDAAGACTAYDFFSSMPSGAFTPDADFHQVLVDFGPEQQPFHIGRASVAVPGVVAGLCRMAQERGTLPLATLLEPAVALAAEGAVLTPGQAYAYQILEPIFRDTPALAAIYFPDGRRYQVGEAMRFPQLARTLRRLGQEGPDFFYRGDLARRIVADQQRNGGLLTATDLAAYPVHVDTPIRIDYRAHTIQLMPHASVGGVLIAFALRLLASLDVAARLHNGHAHLRLLAEVMRLANVARADWEQSPLPVAARPAWFLADDHIAVYARQLAAVLNDASARPEPATPPGPSDTTHISVVDGDGLQVSVTTSAGENAGFVVGDTGVCLNNMLGEADLHPLGFHRLPPGERLVTMMAPVIVARDGRPVLAVGSGGSNRIRSAILQVLSNVLDFALPLEEAVNAPRVHFESGLLQVEGGIDDDVAAALRADGYAVKMWPGRNMFFGGAHAVAHTGSTFSAAGDVRRGGSVVLVGPD